MTVRRLFALLLVLLLAGCGFHLRGSVKLPPEIKRVYVDTLDAGLRQALDRSLEASDVVVAKSAAGADAVVRITGVEETRRVLSVNAGGKAAQYELRSALTVAVYQGDKVLAPPRELSVTRDLLFNDNDLLGSSNEEGALRDEMRRYLVRRIMERLRLLKPDQ